MYGNHKLGVINISYLIEMNRVYFGIPVNNVFHFIFTYTTVVMWLSISLGRCTIKWIESLLSCFRSRIQFSFARVALNPVCSIFTVSAVLYSCDSL